MRHLPKFVPLDHVAEKLSITRAQAYALVRSGELRAIRVGRQWRVEPTELEAFIQRAFDAAKVELGLYEHSELEVPLGSPTPGVLRTSDGPSTVT